MRKLFEDAVKQHSTAIYPLILASALGLSLAGCGGGGGGGKANNELQLPLDYVLDLFCPNAGINDEKCILDDPDNPYARSAINDVTKWDLFNDSPSAKSDFYLWATALAKSPNGENQYYTALALHDLFTQGGSEVARDQAKAAYRSLLDNFFDSQTFYEGGAQLDFIPDTDFLYSDWGAGSAAAGWDGGYTGDADFTPVWYLPSGNGWGGATAAVVFDQFTAGFANNYQNLVFKVKDLPTGNVFIKFQGGGAESEQPFDLATYAVDVPNTTGWKDVTIPLSNFPNLLSYTALSIHTGWGNGGTFLLTEVGFTGDATGNGLVNDVDGNGFVYLYRSGSQQYSLDLRNLAGQNLYDPTGQNLQQLYINQNYAVDAMADWGYVYDPATRMLDRLP